MMSSTVDTKPLFRNVDAEELESETTELESLCLNCEENGITRILLTKIPFYKEIILMSFSCPECGYTNSETQFGGRFQEMGIKYKVLVQNVRDLNRQVVRSDYAVMSIPEIDFEIPPPPGGKGEVTNIEGVIGRAIADLSSDQPKRKLIDPDAAAKLNDFLLKLEKCKNVSAPFHFVVEDLSGNSFIENPFAPQKDDALEVSHYKRTREEDRVVGIIEDEAEESNTLDQIDEESTVDNVALDEIMNFQTNCPTCNSPCETHMKLTPIPHFKEVIIMATNCDACGHRTNEVKSGSGFEPFGVKIELNITDPSDLTRDLLKSETCDVEIPELEFEMGSGTLGGKFTTLEGLLQNIKERLVEDNPLLVGDSASGNMADNIKKFGKRIDEILNFEKKVTIILDDPAGNSYLQNLYAPDPDPHLKVTKYERSFEQNEDLGLNDMKTENY